MYINQLTYMPTSLPYFLFLHEQKQPASQKDPSKQTRVRYSNELKLQVLLEMQMNPSASFADLSRQFDVPSGTIRGWHDSAKQIEEAAHVGMRANAKANLSADPLFKISTAILKLVDLNGRLPPNQRMLVTTAAIQATATQVRNILQKESANNEDLLTDKEKDALQKFQASDTWARKWVRDHESSSMRPMEDNSLRIQQAVAQLPPERVYIMSTVSIFYNALPNRVYVKELEDGRRARAAVGLTSDDMITLYVCANQLGEKVPLYCIGTKDQDETSLRNEKQKIMAFTVEDKAKSTNRTLQEWFRKTFTPFVREKHGSGENILLIVVQEDEIILCPEMLKDASGQIVVESLTASTPVEPNAAEKENGKSSASYKPPPMALVSKSIRHQYKYQMIQDVMDKYQDREIRAMVADHANVPPNRRGLFDGEVPTVADAMRIVQSKWDETIEEEMIIEDVESLRRGDKKAATAGRPKSEIRKMYNRDKKSLVEVLLKFFQNFTPLGQTKTSLEMAVDRMKNTFVTHGDTVLDQKELLEALGRWMVRTHPYSFVFRHFNVWPSMTTTHV
jgi:transposase-like protein